MLNITRPVISELETKELVFIPSQVDPFVNGYKIFAKSPEAEILKGSNADRIKGFPAQTTIYRYPRITSAMLDFIQAVKPGVPKRILCGAGSITAEACGIAADLSHRGVLGEYRIVSSDASPKITTHARKLEFPAGMLHCRPDFIKAAFKEKDKNSPWIIPHEHIRNAVEVTEPTDLAKLKDDQGFDIIFLFNILYHLEQKKQEDILRNVIALSNSGVICFNYNRDLGRVANDGSTRLNSVGRRLSKIFEGHGFVFADLSHEGKLKPSKGSLQRLRSMDNACVAIHPDLAMNMAA